MTKKSLGTSMYPADRGSHRVMILRKQHEQIKKLNERMAAQKRYENKRAGYGIDWSVPADKYPRHDYGRAADSGHDHPKTDWDHHRPDKK